MSNYEDSYILKDLVSKSLKTINKNLAAFDGQLKGARVQLDDFKKRTENIQKLGSGIKSFGEKLTVGITLPVIAAGGAMVKLASDMQETMNKVDVSFGGSTKTVLNWSKTSIKTMGLAQQSALDSAALYGDMATGMGFSQEKAADMAMSLTQLGADLASFKNISNDMAQTALKSVFTGETESLKNLGVVMTEANLQQYGLANGMLKMVRANKKGSKARVQRISELSQLEQVMLRYNYVMAMTKNAHGDFERTGGGAANQTRMFQENLKELGVTFGSYILPYFTKAITKLNELLVKFGQLSPKTQKVILVLGGIIAIDGPLLILFGSLSTSVLAINNAFLLMTGSATTAAGAAATAGAAAGAASAPFILWAGAILGVVAALAELGIAINHFKEMHRIKSTQSLNTNFNEKQLKKLSKLQANMGEKQFIKYIQGGRDDEFSRKYAKNISNQVSTYRQSQIQNTTNNSVTNNNFYGNIGSTGAPMLDNILLNSHNTPAYNL